MPFGFRLTDLTFSSGQSVSLPGAGVTVLVGANNVGKSQALRDIVTAIAPSNVPVPVVVTKVGEERSGSVDDLWVWLRSRYHVDETGGYPRSIVGPGLTLSSNDLRGPVSNDWNKSSAFSYLAPAMFGHLDTRSRLHAADSTPSYDSVLKPPETPFQCLYADPSLESRLSASFQGAFDQGLAVDRHGGNIIAIRCGAVPDPAALGGLFSPEYAKAVRSLPLLADLGDGLKSFFACLLHVAVLRSPILLIDEPEAFLHPPQARQLAWHLAKAAEEQHRQIIVATHSTDILRGVIEASEKVSVIRIEKDGTTNPAHHLDPEAVKTLWSDPLLRVSNILDGLFHARVVLCEGDTDCRYFSAILDLVCGKSGTRRPEVMFTYTGGKQRLATGVRALRAVEVPVSVVADLDLLSNEGELADLWSALGGEWTTIEKDWRIVKAGAETLARNPTVAFIREQISLAIEQSKGAALDPDTAQNIRNLVRVESGWKTLKRAGIEALPSGDSRGAIDRLLPALRQRGLHLVQVGELERFVPQAGGHGPAWLEKVLSMGLLSDSPRAEQFVRSLHGGAEMDWPSGGSGRLPVLAVTEA